MHVRRAQTLWHATINKDTDTTIKTNLADGSNRERRVSALPLEKRSSKHIIQIMSDKAPRKTGANDRIILNAR